MTGGDHIDFPQCVDAVHTLSTKFSTVGVDKFGSGFVGCLRGVRERADRVKFASTPEQRSARATMVCEASPLVVCPGRRASVWLTIEETK